MSTSSKPEDKVLQAYIARFGQVPEQANQLVQYSRTNSEIPTIIYSEAKKSLSKIKKAIKTGKKKKSFKKIIGSPSAKWQVGDEVLISKDRTGILKYIGRVPEMGDDKVWYGLELTSGTMGQNDGSIKGKRYFQANGKRGMFIPESKLRRRLNRKDKERRKSYVEISNQVKELQKNYAGEDAAILYPSSQFKLDSDPNDINNNIKTALHNDSQYVGGQPSVNDIHTLVFESKLGSMSPNPDQAYKYGNGGGQYQSATMHNQQQHESPSPHRDIASKKNKKKKKKKMHRTRSGSSGSSTSQSSREQERYYHHNNHHNGQDEDEYSEDVSRSDEVSDLEDDRERERDSSPTVKTFDTLLKYILRQKGQYREGLLDVYANPQTHALIVEAFSQMKQLQPNEQAFLWPALLRRWSKYTHKI